MSNHPRKYIERRYSRLSFFVLHVIFAMTMAGIVFITPAYRDPGTRVIGMLWFGLLLYHGVKVYIDNSRDRAIERTIQQPYTDVYDDNPQVVSYEKPKRMTRLADLVDEDEPEVPEYEGEELPLWKR